MILTLSDDLYSSFQLCSLLLYATAKLWPIFLLSRRHGDRDHGNADAYDKSHDNNNNQQINYPKCSAIEGREILFQLKSDGKSFVSQLSVEDEKGQ